MVVQGGFSLQLIDAETQQPLNEYRGPSGAVYYAEAKPGGEYFLRFQVLQDDIQKEGNDTTNIKDSKHDTETETMMYFRPAVDGKDLGFYTNLTKSDGARDVGLWTYVNGVGTNQALKFETAAAATTNESETTTAGSTPSAVVASGTAASSSSVTAVSQEDCSVSASKTPKGPPRLHMGNVQVQISKGVFTGYQKRVYTGVQALATEETVMAETAAPISASSSLQEDEEDEEAIISSAGHMASGPNKKEVTEAPIVMDPVPVLRSGEGAAKFQQKFSEECPTYQPGETLETITIHYGSTAALVQAGILVPISGMVPQYVGGATPHPLPTTGQTAGTTKAVTVVPPNASNTAAPSPPTQGKVAVPNPLLDVVSSSSPPTGVKRLHGTTATAVENGNNKGEGEIQPPAAKKQRLSVPAVEPALVEPSAAAVISK